MAEKTNTGLVSYAKAQVGLPYWYGCYGQTADASLYKSKKAQYPDNYTASDFSSQYGKRVHDCAGLIKGYLWSDSATSTPKYNSAQDKSANGLYTAAKTKGKISTIPNTPGILVFIGTSTSKITHVGVYGGDGYVYEAKGHSYGVVKSTYKASNWNYWAQCSYITDDTNSTKTTTTTTKSTTTTSSSTTLAVGTVVNFTGTKHYTSANATTGKTCKGGEAKITQISKGSKHPYHLIHTGTNCTVYGWVDEADIKTTSTTTTTTTSSSTSTTTKKATDAAQSKDTSFSGTYEVTASKGVNIRNGAGTGKSILGTIPKGTTVQNYGYYTKVGTVKWLYVQVTYNKVQYTGFICSTYLKKK